MDTLSRGRCVNGRFPRGAIHSGHPSHRIGWCDATSHCNNVAVCELCGPKVQGSCWQQIALCTWQLGAPARLAFQARLALDDAPVRRQAAKFSTESTALNAAVCC